MTSNNPIDAEKRADSIEEVTITGQVLDNDTKESIIGASILVVGTTSGTITDFDGNFSLSVPSLPVNLRITYTGYSTEEIAVTSGNRVLEVYLSEGLNIDEVVVTSRKREESMKDVPIAVTAISGRKLEAVEATDISAAANLAPNVNFSFNGAVSGSSSSAVVYVRGVGQSDFLQTLDPGVGIYVDGVYMGRSVGSVLELVDAERLEVLRGPQGSLFGRNTMGGAISLTSKEPTDEFGGNIKAVTGSYNRIGLEGALNIPFSDKFSGRIAAKYHKRDGYVQRLLAGDDLGDDNLLGTRANFLYKASDKLKLKFNFDYTKEDEAGAAEEPINPAGGFVALYDANIVGDETCPNTTNPDCFINTISREEFTTNEIAPNSSQVDLWGAALIAEYEINESVSVKSISAYRSLDAYFTRGSDGGPAVIFQTDNDYVQDQFSQELQLNVNNDKLDFVTGLYYFKETGSDENLVEAAALPFIPVFPLISGGEVDNSSYAVYGEGTFHLTEKFHLTAGLRYTTENKSFNPNSFAERLPPEAQYLVPRGFRDLDFSRVTWRAIAAYDVNENINAYGSVSTGFKGGGFDVRYSRPQPDPNEFGPENSTNYEVGLKTFVPAADLRLNVALFSADYTDIHVVGTPPGNIATSTFNGAEANIKGAELELDWSPAKNLILSGSLGLLDAKYIEINEGVAGVTTDDKLIRTPTNTYNLALSYLFKFKGGSTLLPRLDMNSQNNIHFVAINNDEVFEPGYVHVNFLATFKTKAKNIAITAGILNVTDQRYLLSGAYNPGLGYSIGTYSRPRNWMTSIKYNF